jgi:hypothetical protein
MSIPFINLSGLTIGILLLLGAILPLNACLRHTRRPAYLISLYLLAYCEIVTIAQVTSVIHWLNLGAYVIGGIILIVAAQIVWRKSGRPPILGPFAGQRLVLPLLRVDPALWMLGAVVMVAMMLNAFLIISTPPNNFDSMTYHLSRVGYFLQHQSLSPWATPNLRQTSFPYHAEVGFLWTILFAGSDRLTGFVQWAALIASAIAVAGTARAMGASVRKSIFAGLILFTFPMMILQSLTTQNDLVVASFACAGLYLFALGAYQKRARLLMLSGIAIALGLGTKTTMIIALPGLGIAILLIAWLTLRRRLKLFVLWAISCAVAFALLSSLVYIQNIRYYQNPLTSNDIIDPTIGSITTSPLLQSVGTFVVYNYQSLDFTGLPTSIASYLTNAKANLLTRFVQHFPGIAIQYNTTDGPSSTIPDSLWTTAASEDISWFGLIAFILIAAAILRTLYFSLRSRQFALLAPAIILFGFSIAISFLLSWTPYKGRYFVLPVVCAAPILAWVYPEKPSSVWLRWCMILPALGIMLWTLSHNVNKPLIGPNAIWTKSPLEVQSMSAPIQKAVMADLDQVVPQNAILATELGMDDWDYPLFGSQMQRRVLPVNPAIRNFDPRLVTSSGADFFLVSPIERSFLGQPEGMQLIKTLPNDWLLFQITGKPAQPLTAQQNALLYGTSSSNGLFTLSPAWDGQVGLTQIQSRAPWEIEVIPEGTLFWLGQGSNQGLGLRFWSNFSQKTQATLSLKLTPGPSLPSPDRTLTVRLDNRQLYKVLNRDVQKIPFNRSGMIDVPVTLYPGINEMVISIDDAPTVLEQPNGDRRPLMAMLNQVYLKPAVP